jgi:glutamate racemase
MFDSGVGGLTVARAFMDQVPGFDVVYLGDTAHTPYGTKSPGTVTRYALEGIRFLLSRGAAMVIIACNTAAGVALDTLSAHFQLPILDGIGPAADHAVKATRNGRIGVIGTRTAVDSGVYEKRILAARPDIRVYTRSCPLLVPLVEEGWLKKPETRMIVKDYLRPLKVRRVDTLIMGCTHYPLLADIIQVKIGRRVVLVDPAAALAEHAGAFLDRNPTLAASLPKNGRLQVCVTDRTDRLQATAAAILRRKVDLTVVQL